MPADLQYVSPPAERQLLDKPELHQEAAQPKTSDAQQLLQPATVQHSLQRQPSTSTASSWIRSLL